MVIQSNFNDMVVWMLKCNAGPILALYLCRNYICAVPIHRTQIFWRIVVERSILSNIDAIMIQNVLDAHVSSPS